MRKLVLKESAALDEKQMNKVMGGDGGTVKNDSITNRNDSITNSSDVNEAMIDGALSLPSVYREGTYYLYKRMMRYISYMQQHYVKTVDGGVLPEVTITAERSKISK